jgi:hypothetical protein
MKGTWVECLYMVSMYDPESGSIYSCPCNSEQEVLETFTDLFRSWTELEEYDYYVDRFDEDDIREEKTICIIS